MDPRQMASLMRQFGIKNEEIKSNRVIIETLAGKKLIIDSPQVLEIDMQGQKSYQISGPVREIGSKDENPEAENVAQQLAGSTDSDEIEKLADNDIGLVAEQAKVSREDARKALEETSGDIAEAILKAGKKSDYMDQVGQQRELVTIIEKAKVREFKERSPLLFESKPVDQLKSVHSLHQLGKFQIEKFKREEKQEVVELIRARLETIIELCNGGEKTIINDDLKRKSHELLEWLK
jgi:nascent polypeptide-associated complex subunit alpha